VGVDRLVGHRQALDRFGLPYRDDRPQAIYERPTNVFVASFIGSPAMNLVDSRLEADNGSLYASLGEHRLRLPDRPLRWPGLGRYVGRDVVLGIRPEGFDDARAQRFEAGATIDVGVALAEPLGAETIVHFDTVSAPDLKARLEGRVEVSAGERVALTVELERMHFFDPETEAAIA
jgi:multiple sugar transport system ATP-binding protein